LTGRIKAVEKLIRVIEEIQSKLEGLRKRSLKETPTRTIVIDPLLESLGWDVRDPDEVQLEYPTVDSKSVDYALLLNSKPALLVEAKALDDPLNDVKGITQVVGYAANDGIVWCVLTNGVVWKIYRSIEQCQAPEKLMYEVSLDPRSPEGMPVEQIARQLWRFSREEMAKGTLDAIGEQTFTDGKVRKAVDGILRDAPRTLLNLVRTAAGDDQLTPQRIKESLARIWAQSTAAMPVLVAKPASGAADTDLTPSARSQAARSQAARKSWVSRRQNASPTSAPFDEAHHLEGKPKEVLELYRAIDRVCLSMKPGVVERRYLNWAIKYSCETTIFCWVALRHDGIQVYLKLKYSQLENPPTFARHVSNLSPAGNVALAINSMAQINDAVPLIRKSFEGQM
jgi:predicted transport protein